MLVYVQKDRQIVFKDMSLVGGEHIVYTYEYSTKNSQEGQINDLVYSKETKSLVAGLKNLN